jgi:hypothetical protein
VAHGQDLLMTKGQVSARAAALPAEEWGQLQGMALDMSIPPARASESESRGHRPRGKKGKQSFSKWPM